MRELRKDADRLAKPMRTTARRRREAERARLLRGLGEPEDLAAVAWPNDIAFPTPDQLLANATRLVAVGLIGARADAASAAKVSWAVGVSGLVDAVWLIGPKGGVFAHQAVSTLSRLGDSASRIGIAAVEEGTGRGVVVMRRPASGRPDPDFRGLIRDTLTPSGRAG